MAGKCKCCGLPDDLHKSLDEKLLDGVSFDVCSNWLKIQGHAISSVSIMRHANAHVQGFVAPSVAKAVPAPSVSPVAAASDPNLMAIDADEIIERLGLQDYDIHTQGGCKKFVSAAIREMLANQAVLTLAKQESFMAGESGFPSEQIKGLIDLLKLSGLLESGGAIHGITWNSPKQ